VARYLDGTLLDSALSYVLVAKNEPEAADVVGVA
jgi:hypothetical protein